MKKLSRKKKWSLALHICLTLLLVIALLGSSYKLVMAKTMVELIKQLIFIIMFTFTLKCEAESILDITK